MNYAVQIEIAHELPSVRMWFSSSNSKKIHQLGPQTFHALSSSDRCNKILVLFTPVFLLWFLLTDRLIRHFKGRENIIKRTIKLFALTGSKWLKQESDIYKILQGK